MEILKIQLLPLTEAINAELTLWDIFLPKAPRCKHGEYSHSVTHFCRLLFGMQRHLYCSTCCRCNHTEPSHGAAGSASARATMTRGEPAEPLKAPHSQAQPETLPCAPHSHEGAHTCYSTAKRRTAKLPFPFPTPSNSHGGVKQLLTAPAAPSHGASEHSYFSWEKSRLQQKQTWKK